MIQEKFTNRRVEYKEEYKYKTKRHSNPKAPIHQNLINTQKRIKYKRKSFSIIL
jgi:hypothetical protein